MHIFKKIMSAMIKAFKFIMNIFRPLFFLMFAMDAYVFTFRNLNHGVFGNVSYVIINFLVLLSLAALCYVMARESHRVGPRFVNLFSYVFLTVSSVLLVVDSLVPFAQIFA